MIRSFMTGLLIFSFLSFAVLAAEAEPQNESIEVFDELSLGDLLNLKISTGSFLDLDLQKSPLSMTIITSEMVRASGARHMSELLEIYVPGFIYNINKWNGTVWGMRGVVNDRNSKIIYLVNEVEKAEHRCKTRTNDSKQF